MKWIIALFIALVVIGICFIKGATQRFTPKPFMPGIEDVEGDEL